MKKLISNFLVTVCILSLAVLSVSAMVSAKGLTGQQAKTKALQKVPGAHVAEVEPDYEKGKKVYEVKLYKGTKEYELTYRASDGKLIAYGWEEEFAKRSSKALLSEDACKKLAKKKVPGASVLWIERDDDDGIEIYEVEMKKGSVKYELKYHGRTGKLLEYKWKK